MDTRLLVAFSAFLLPSLPSWTIAAEVSGAAKSSMVTRWDRSLVSSNIHSEYPRPQMIRPEWLSLNGSWEWAFSSKGGTNEHSSGRILVPFPMESALSGVRQAPTEQQCVWYMRRFEIPKQWLGKTVLLHFGAVDWESRVWLNGKFLGEHQGGFDGFSFDITDALKDGAGQELSVSVYDPTDAGTQPRGNQQRGVRPGFHTSCSGIWQSVWLEPVSKQSIEKLKLVPYVDSGTLALSVETRGQTTGVTVEAVALSGGTEVARVRGQANQPLNLTIPKAKLWSPDSPFLYDLKVKLWQGSTNLDEVASYFGMRKISVETNGVGAPVVRLNNQDLFQFGPADAGYWPDGIYTAPSDEALRSDIEAMKQMGFNLCFKQEKVEPDRWYYWCDKLGLLVWQQMPSGDRSPAGSEEEIRRRAHSAKQFEAEVARIIEDRGNHPCIVMWVPFYHRRGQYETPRILSWMKTLDPSRLVLSTGGPDLEAGDVFMVSSFAGRFSGSRPRVIGECGRIDFPVEGHLWNTNILRKLRQPPTQAEFITTYYRLMETLNVEAKKYGYSGAVFSQLTDVESDVTGLLTCDRVFKVQPREIEAARKKAWEKTPK